MITALRGIVATIVYMNIIRNIASVLISLLALDILVYLFHNYLAVRLLTIGSTFKLIIAWVFFSMAIGLLLWLVITPFYHLVIRLSKNLTLSLIIAIGMAGLFAIITLYWAWSAFFNHSDIDFLNTIACTTVSLEAAVILFYSGAMAIEKYE